MPLKKPITEKQFVVTLEGMPVIFSKVTGVKATAEKTPYSDGSTGIEYTHVGMVTYPPITLSKVLDATEDKKLIDFAVSKLDAKDNNDAAGFTVTIKPVNPDVAGTPVSGGLTITLVGCQISGYTLPNADRGSTSMAMIELEIVFTGITTS